MKKRLIMTLFIGVSISSMAQQQYSFSLEEAVTYALENNRSAKNAELDVEAAKKQKWETTSMGLPQISLNADYNHFLKQQVSLIPAEFFGGNPGEFAEVVFGTKQSASATATLNQLLFDGSYLVGLQSAKVFLEISKNAKIKTDLEVRKLVVNAYANVLLAEETIAVLEGNKAILERNVSETQKIVENGFAEEENVEQLQITLANISNSLNNTRRLHTLSIKMFNITLGLPLDEKVALKDNLNNLVLINANSDLLESELIIEENIDYKIAENNKRSQELLLKYEKTKALPTLNAFLNGGYQGYSNEFTFFDRDQKWFGTSLFGLSMNVPIFSSLGRTARTQRAKIEFEKAKTDLTEAEQKIQLQFQAAKSDYQFSIEQYQTLKKNLELAERIEYKNQIKYSEGLASSFDFKTGTNPTLCSSAGIPSIHC